MKRGWVIAGVVVIIVIVIQFFQPEKNLQEKEDGNDLLTVLEVPEEVSALLINGCYDCHSNQTQYPWYSRISPVSWFLNGHIVNGKEELNLSEFGQLDTLKRLRVMSDISEVVESGSMPLQSYLLLHRDARLTPDEVEVISNWTDGEADKLLKK